METHPDLAPLEFLLGRWEGAGIGGYPTIESFRFGQEISFSHNGKPFLDLRQPDLAARRRGPSRAAAGHGDRVLATPAR